MKKPTEIMTKKFNPRDLAKEQANAYREYIIGVLDEIKGYIENGQFSKVNNLLFNSPAGDGYGMDNNVIDFGYDKKRMDINEALNYLTFLTQYANGQFPVDEEFCEWKEYIPRV